MVYIETVVKGRRVFLDFRNDPEDFEFGALSSEAREYLARSKALIPKPIERLRIMNPDAVTLYADHDIDIAAEPLEIAVCAQHNNGGLAGNIWWASTNIKHLFVVGEVNGSHGVARPGGSALNAGQVGGFRAAEFIANRYAHWTLDTEAIKAQAARQTGQLDQWMTAAKVAPRTWQAQRKELQERMTKTGAHIRSPESLKMRFPKPGSNGAAWRRMPADFKVWRGCETR